MSTVIAKFESSSSQAVHSVLMPEDGIAYCTCMGWKTSKTSPKSCSHLKKLVAAGTLTSGFALAGDGAAAGAAPPPQRVPDPPAGVGKPDVLLAESWDGDKCLCGWWLSEKLDGVRAVWDGHRFVSRGGTVYNAPEWFTAGFPDYLRLDGELWMGRGKFQLLSGHVRRLQPDESAWQGIRYLVFDVPSMAEKFEQRMEAYELACELSDYLVPVPQVTCRSQEHLYDYLRDVIDNGGEGLMARRPGSMYEPKRSSTLLKIKETIDAEAVVTGHQAGSGRLVGLMGALELVFPNGVKFRCGTGFTDAQRAAPPPVGSTVTIRYQELSADGIPRFPAFVGVRDYE